MLHLIKMGYGLKKILILLSELFQQVNQVKKNLKNVSVFHIDQNNRLIEKIMSENANIENNEWILSDVTIIKPVNGIFEKNFFKKI